MTNFVTTLSTESAEHKRMPFRPVPHRPGLAASLDGPLLQRQPACPCGGGCPRCQTAPSDLKISEPGDAHEREADAAAERVMRMSGSEEVRVSHGASGLQGKRAAAEGNRMEALTQAGGESAADSGVPSAPPVVRGALDSSGQPLDAETRAFFEPRFGRDFSGVRVHTDTAAASSAKAVNALAYTFGRDIVFDEGAYSPGSPTGKSLLAHELAHVMQQDHAGTDSPRADNGSVSKLSAAPGGTVQRQTAGAFAAVTLGEIQCMISDDYLGDDVYIKVGDQLIWGPESMSAGDIKTINRRVNFSTDPLVISVFDQETIGQDDLIGTVTIPRPTTEAEIGQAPHSGLLATHGLYRLHFNVHRV